MITLYEILIFALAIIILIAYVKTLVRQAKRKQWTWFVVCLLFFPAMIIYWAISAFK